jgi:BirA family transcriptional regulator, biotin operon repressor / biotin---[acetyl-CoA-carboxylase] ligase
VLNTTGSTSDDVALAAQVGAPEGHTVIAAEQTAGRGRRGASWFSPPAHGLYVSTLLRPDRWPVMRQSPDTVATSLITLMAGVAVASAVADACQARVEVKWPNDVMVRTPALGGAGSPGGRSADAPWRKLAGILAEGASDGRALRTVVLGIGLNVFRAQAPADVAARMIALEDLDACRAPETAASLLRRLVAALLARLASGVVQLSSGRVDDVRQAWRALAPSVEGTSVRWHHDGLLQQGRACGIDDTGALLVRLDGNGVVAVHGGEVEWMLGGDAHEA